MTNLESLAGLLSLLASTCLTGTQAQPRSMSWRVESSTASAQSSLHILLVARLGWAGLKDRFSWASDNSGLTHLNNWKQNPLGKKREAKTGNQERVSHLVIFKAILKMSFISIK